MHIYTLKVIFSPIRKYTEKYSVQPLLAKDFIRLVPLQPNVVKGCTELSEINLMSRE
jgi:hypothetical protein